MDPKQETKQELEILVVDDERTLCRSVEKILSRRRHRVEHALSVPEALDLIEGGKKFDLIILDLMMPQVGGMELLKVVKDRWPEITVLIITGYASIASAVEAVRLGAKGYLPKPFTPDELEAAVDKALTANPSPKSDTLLPSGIIDVDLPFDANEVARATSTYYVEKLTRSDVLRSDGVATPADPSYCAKGERPCKRFMRKGTCEEEACPIVVKERAKAAKSAGLAAAIFDPIDVDMPFSRTEVEAATSEDYMEMLGRSDMPIPALRTLGIKSETPMRVLVVDDEAVVVNSVRKIFSRRNLAVDAVFNAQDAVKRIAAESFDVILLDLKLPDGDGFEVLSTAKKLRPNTPVIIVTGYASIDSAVEAVQRGAAEYVPKPFTPDELYNVTKRVLARSAA